MSMDSGSRRGDRSPDLWRLPDILDVKIRRRRFERPKRMTVAGTDQQLKEAIEVEIEVSEPFVIRALNPVLWIGDVPLTIAEGAGRNVYRFLAAESGDLREGAPISISWGTSPPDRKKTRHNYNPPQEDSLQ